MKKQLHLISLLHRKIIMEKKDNSSQPLQEILNVNPNADIEEKVSKKKKEKKNEKF